MVKLQLSAYAGNDFEPVEQFGQYTLMAPALLKWRRYAFFSAAVFDAELAVFVDAQVAVEIFGFEQQDRSGTQDGHVVDLSGFPLKLKTQIVEYGAVLTAGEEVVEIVSGISFSLDALAQPVQLLLQPFALPCVQQFRRLKVFQQF